MADPKPKRGLGRGFSSLIPTQLVEEEFDVTAAPASSALRDVATGLVDPNPHQPRTDFAEDTLAELTDSIRTHGILQPLVVTQAGERFELIAGERRLRAAKLAGLATVPVIVRSFDEQAKLELAIIENLQRTDLNAIETATAYRKLIDQFNLTVKQVGERVGKNFTTVSNTTRLLSLPLEVKRMISDGTIPETLGRAVLMVPADKQLEFARLAVERGWSVRQAETYGRTYGESGGDQAKAVARTSNVSAYTESLGSYLGTKVTQVATAKGGRLVIEYYSDEELERIYQAIKGETEA